MTSTDFLASLTPASKDDHQTRVCDFFLYFNKRVKRPDKRCLGWTESDLPDTRLYYYHLDGGVLEIEVRPDGRGGYARRVTDFLTDPRDLNEMLGELYIESSASET